MSLERKKIMRIHEDGRETFKVVRIYTLEEKGSETKNKRLRIILYVIVGNIRTYSYCKTVLTKIFSSYCMYKKTSKGLC